MLRRRNDKMTSKIPTIIDPKKLEKIANFFSSTLKQDYPIYFKFDLKYLKLLQSKMNHNIIEEKLDIAFTDLFFKIESMHDLKSKSNVMSFLNNREFFEISYLNFEWNLLDIDEIISNKEIQKRNKLLKVETPTFNFE